MKNISFTSGDYLHDGQGAITFHVDDDYMACTRAEDDGAYTIEFNTIICMPGITVRKEVLQECLL